MTTLHLGILDLPYSDGTASTGDVAEILEAKYGVMQAFADNMGSEAIASALEHSVVNAVESLLLGANAPGLSLTAEGEGEIEAAFRVFLYQQEMDGLVEGVPTAASLAGVNHRFAHPYAKANSARPSFIDTGLYESSFRSWVD